MLEKRTHTLYFILAAHKTIEEQNLINEIKYVSRARKKTFYLKFIIRLFDGSNGATRENLLDQKS
jgi:hypothetical protein